LIAHWLAEKDIHKNLWRLALPIMVSNISLPLLGLVDTAILGHLSDNRFLAAVAMGASLFVFVLWSFAFLRMGTTALIAQNSGKCLDNNIHKKVHDETTILHCALLLAAALGLVLLISSPFLISAMLALTSAVDDITPLAHEYLQIRFYFAPVTLINYALLGYFIGLGHTKITLVLLVTTNVLNGILDYVFVYHFNLNSSGVAYASNISEVFQMCVGLYFARATIFTWLGLHSLKAHFHGFLNLNVQLFIRTFFLLFTFAYFMSIGAQTSAALLSANAILFNLLIFISNALDGFALASESLVGKAYGAKDKDLIKKIIAISGLWSFLCALLFTLILALFHDPILALLTSQVDVVALLDKLIYWLIFLPMAGFACYWLDGIYIGLAAAKEMRNSILFAVFILFLPLQMLLQDWSLHGLWFAFFAFLLGRALWQLFKLPAVMSINAN
jgi:MATE family multidrug resistance protein